MRHREQAVQGPFPGLRCCYQPLGDAFAHLVAAPVRHVCERLVEHVFETGFEPCTSWSFGIMSPSSVCGMDRPVEN